MINEKIDLFKGAHKTIPASYNPTGPDPLPSADQLLSLKEICPDACLFSIIPKVGSEETDTASEDGDQEPFPPLLISLYQQPFSDIEGDELKSYAKSLWRKYHVTDQQCEILEAQTRSQSINELWFKHRERRITAS